MQLRGTLLWLYKLSFLPCPDIYICLFYIGSGPLLFETHATSLGAILNCTSLCADQYRTVFSVPSQCCYPPFFILFLPLLIVPLLSPLLNSFHHAIFSFAPVASSPSPFPRCRPVYRRFGDVPDAGFYIHFGALRPSANPGESCLFSTFTDSRNY